MKGVSLQTKFGLMFADMDDGWEDTPENRQALTKEIEDGAVGQRLKKQEEEKEAFLNSIQRDEEQLRNLFLIELIEKSKFKELAKSAVIDWLQRKRMISLSGLKNIADFIGVY